MLLLLHDSKVMKITTHWTWMMLLPALAIGAETDPRGAQGSDRDFVVAAARAGQQEVFDATRAATQSRMEGVRHLAQMLRQDHELSNERLGRLAHAKSMSLPPPEPSPSPTASFSDQEYVAGQVQAHEEAIALFRAEAERGTDREFRAFAAQVLPTLRKHLAALHALQTP